MSGLERISARLPRSATRFTMTNFIVGAMAVGATLMTLATLAALTGAAYQWTMHHMLLDIATPLSGGLAIGLVYCSTFLYSRAYTIPAYLRGAHRPARILMAWNIAFLALFVMAFLTQTTVAISRAIAIVFYVTGLLSMIALETTIRSAIVRMLASGALMPRRVMLIGSRSDTSEFSRRLAAAVPQSERIGVRIVATAEVEQRATHDTMSEAIATARALLPDEIVIMAPWNNAPLVEGIVAAFEQLPVAIHLDGGPVLARFSDPHLRRVGGLSTVSIAELPLSPVQVIIKRGFDVVGAALGLLLLSPVFAVIALLIRRETPGDAIFKQDRLGFNQQKFLIYKFRTMTATDNGPVIEQAKPGDLRITRIGALLRRTSLDELPQLINVLKGDMSLVGPRPHAVAHDRDYEQRIRRYPRRLNIKPGMTGWAQVNGYRGLTDTDEKMRRRVEFDLYYIDNWSILFDVYILILTVLSPRTFNNAG